MKKRSGLACHTFQIFSKMSWVGRGIYKAQKGSRLTRILQKKVKNPRKEISEVNSMPTDDDDSKYVSDSSDDDENISSSDRLGLIFLLKYIFH